MWTVCVGSGPCRKLGLGSAIPRGSLAFLATVTNLVSPSCKLLVLEKACLENNKPTFLTPLAQRTCLLPPPVSDRQVSRQGHGNEWDELHVETSQSALSRLDAAANHSVTSPLPLRWLDAHQVTQTATDDVTLSMPGERQRQHLPKSHLLIPVLRDAKLAKTARYHTASPSDNRR